MTPPPPPAMHLPPFSIITPSYNSGDALARTAASIREQVGCWEHLIVDGGSTDGSLDLARRLASGDPDRVRVWSEPDRGLYDAMNRGIDRAAGRYLLFLGAGDVLFPRILGHVRDALPDHDRGFLYGNVVLYPTDVLYDGPSSRLKIYGRNVPHQAIFYGRDVFWSVGRYDLAYPKYADWALNIRCFADGQVAKWYLPLVVAGFEMGGASSAGDPAFRRDRDGLYRRHMGLLRFARAKLDHIRRGRPLPGVAPTEPTAEPNGTAAVQPDAPRP